MQKKLNQALDILPDARLHELPIDIIEGSCADGGIENGRIKITTGAVERMPPGDLAHSIYVIGRKFRRSHPQTN